MGKVLITRHQKNFHSEVIEVIRFPKNNYTAGTHLSEKPTITTRINGIQLKCNRVEHSAVSFGRQSIFFFRL